MRSHPQPTSDFLFFLVTLTTHGDELEYSLHFLSICYFLIYLPGALTHSRPAPVPDTTIIFRLITEYENSKTASATFRLGHDADLGSQDDYNIPPFICPLPPPCPLLRGTVHVPHLPGGLMRLSLPRLHLYCFHCSTYKRCYRPSTSYPECPHRPLHHPRPPQTPPPTPNPPQPPRGLRLLRFGRRRAYPPLRP